MKELADIESKSELTLKNSSDDLPDFIVFDKKDFSVLVFKPDFSGIYQLNLKVTFPDFPGVEVSGDFEVEIPAFFDAEHAPLFETLDVLPDMTIVERDMRIYVLPSAVDIQEAYPVEILVLGPDVVTLTKDPLTSQPALLIRGVWDDTADDGSEVQVSEVTVKLTNANQVSSAYLFTVTV